ncbi:MAG: CDP-diacylglycerol--serine O-phosphatidyltransferase [Bacteroidales bacterium]|nr:CDP-diacylglycerol--serine O-phosphatidyltransferase [Bacteroidales bacterium]
MSIRKHIPNTITSLNLACGTLGVVCTAMGRTDLAFALMLAGAVFDFLDGMSARALGAYSPMGKELDSLADNITFGLLPAFMLFKAMHSVYGAKEFFVWIPLLIAVFSGLRLAKFNVDERQTSSFIGMPTPACAMICGSLGCYLALWPGTGFAALALTPWFIPALSLVLCFLLVCEIPMFSMKIHKGEGMNRDMVLRIIFACIAIAGLITVIAAGWSWTIAVFLAFTAYILINMVAAVCAPKKTEK